MKKLPLILTAVFCSWGVAQAQQQAPRQQQQQPQQQQQQQVQPQQQQQQVEDEEELRRQQQLQTPGHVPPSKPFVDPQGRPFGDDPPPGRPFTEDAPPGRPFIEGHPPGRAFDPQRDQQIQDPAGAARQQQQQQRFEADPQRQQQVQQFQTVLSQLRTERQVTDQTRQRLQQQITTSIGAQQQVPEQFVVRLADDLATSLARVRIDQTTELRLATAMDVVLSAAAVQPQRVETALNEVQTILLNAGVARPEARSILCDLHLIATELSPDPAVQFHVPVPR